MAAKPTGDDDNGERARKIWYVLRDIQRETACSTKTLKLVFQRLRPFLNIGNTKVPKVDKILRSQANIMRLDGCVNCNMHVFTPDDRRRRCPDCRHPRYDRNGKPNEVCLFCLIIDCPFLFWLFCIIAGVLVLPATTAASKYVSRTWI